MSDKKLLVLVTRMEGPDEWENVWGFRGEHLLAVIRRDKVTPFAVNDIPELDLNNELNADVWVIHGSLYNSREISELIDAALNKVDWKQHQAEIRVHFGSAAQDEFYAALESSPHENTKELFKRVQHYGIGDTIEPNHPVVKFARLPKPSSDTDYNEALEALTARNPVYMRTGNPLHMKIANTIHHLSYVLQPLDIDVQGLIATDFAPDYWREVVEDYKDGKALEKLNRANDLVYSTAVSGDNAVERVLAEAEQRFGKEEAWTTAWNELQQHYLPKKRPPENIKQIVGLLQNGSEANLKEFKTHVSKDNNPIHEWVKNINRTLSAIRDALSKREKDLNGEKEKELRQAS